MPEKKSSSSDGIPTGQLTKTLDDSSDHRGVDRFPVPLLSDEFQQRSHQAVLHLCEDVILPNDERQL